jgi:uncharacterized protein (TIGR03437 family)
MLRNFGLLLTCLSIAASAPAQIVNVSSQIVVFTYNVGATNVPSAQLDTITGQLGTTINLTAVNVSYGGGAANWLSVSPTVGTLPTALSLRINNPNLGAGTYSAILQPTFDTPINPASTTQITVFLVVTNPSGGGGGSQGPPSMTLTPSSLSFSYQAGGTEPVPQSISVTTSDNSAYSATVATIDGNPWLNIFPASGATPGAPIISANPAGLASGTYYGNIHFSSSSGAVGLVTVTFTVSGPALATSPSALTFNVPQGFGLSAYQPIKVTATVPTTFTALTNDNGGNWLQTDTSTTKTPATVNVRVNTGTLTQGQYQGTLTFQEDPTYGVTIPVTLNVGLPTSLKLAPTTLNFSYVTGSPAPAGQTVAISSATSAPNQNVAIASTTSDGNAWLSTSLSAATTPSNVTVNVNPAGLPAGVYFGTVSITPTVLGASPQTVSVNLVITGSGHPVISSVVNTASYLRGAPVSPGEIVAIFGSGLGPKTLASYTLTSNGTIPTTVAATQVTFDGIPAPILYASDGQTGVQIPYGIGSTSTVVSVVYQGIAPTATVTLPVAIGAPGIFTVNQSGTGEAAVANQDGTVNSAANPAAKGSVISLFATGEGQTYPKSVEGTITPVNGPYPPPVEPVAVSIGGVGTQVKFVGEAPASITGLLQVNVQVPANIPSGANAVVLQLGPLFSQSGVTVFIQ